MKVVHVTNNDLMGGAARAAYRQHLALQTAEVDSKMFVALKIGRDDSVIKYQTNRALLPRFARNIRRARLNLAYSRQQKLSPDNLSDPFSDDRTSYTHEVVKQLPPADILNLHWIATFIDYQTFFPQVIKDSAIVWTFHDLQALTGGCHYDNGCYKYQKHCGACPQLGSSDDKDLSSQIWERKNAVYAKIPPNKMTIVTPSRWLAGEAAKSPLLGRFPVEVIPNSLDLELFQPVDKVKARQELGLPLDSLIVLFVAQTVNNPRKGIDFLSLALAGLEGLENFMLISAGAGVVSVPPAVPYRPLGEITAEAKMAQIYSAADLFIIPSIQDNLPNTVMESLACGTPVVGFNVGGIPDMVRPYETGALAPAGDVAALRLALKGLLLNNSLRLEMGHKARKQALSDYSPQVQAASYLKLYQEARQRFADPQTFS